MNAVLADRTEIQRALALFQNPESKATEISAFKVELDEYHKEFRRQSLGTIVAHFADPTMAAEEITNLLNLSRRSSSPEAVYFLLNPVNPALAHRSLGAFEARAEHRAQDSDITALRYLLIDLDPLRPAGISANEAEHLAALDRALRIQHFLIDELKWPAPVRADSGNGVHLIPRLADLENNPANRDLLRKTLQVLSQLFSNEQAKVDLTTFNPSRICKLYGTICRKGSNTGERPHRLASLLEIPDSYHDHRVTATQLRAFVDKYSLESEPRGGIPTAQHESPRGLHEPLDIEALLQRNAIDYEKREWNGGSKYILTRCLFNADHSGTSVAILQFVSGALEYRCLHDGCAGKRWHDARDRLDPAWRERRGTDGTKREDTGEKPQSHLKQRFS
jgi:hypothetical protein